MGLVFILFYELNPEAWWPVFTALGRAALSSGGVEESRKPPLTQNQRSALTPRDGKGGAVPWRPLDLDRHSGLKPHGAM